MTRITALTAPVPKIGDTVKPIRSLQALPLQETAAAIDACLKALAR